MSKRIPPRAGYTLPVFACASAVAAYRCLCDLPWENKVTLDLINPSETADLPIQQAAKLSDRQALGITLSDPGDNLDITRNTPVWALVERVTDTSTPITLQGGEGVGRQLHFGGKAAIYRYAQNLLQFNLSKFLQENDQIQVTIILPEGRELARRTSNAAFGVVDGLSLLGTTGISRPLTAPEQLELYQEELSQKAQQFPTLVFCVGENGKDLAAKSGINSQQLVKTANWLGPMLASAAVVGLDSILLFGYHGKLIKLAGGIFHTHHFLADGRREILTAYLAQLGAPHPLIQAVWQSSTCAEALDLLRQEEQAWASTVYQTIAESIDSRSQTYVMQQTGKNIRIGTVLFDSQRQVIATSNQGAEIYTQLLK